MASSFRGDTDEQMTSVRKKYLINVDFSTVSRIHLNPLWFRIDTRCEVGPKITKDSGPAYASREEAEWFSKQQGSLVYRGREVTNVEVCKLCAALPGYDLA
jgi:hypothetical protein